MKGRVKVTIEHADGTQVLEFDALDFSQTREVNVERDLGTGDACRLVPSPLVTTRIVGTRWSADQKSEGPVARPFTLWLAPRADAETLEALKAEIRQALADPSYHIVSNGELRYLIVQPGAIVSAEWPTEEQTRILRDAIRNASEDPNHIEVLNFDVYTTPFPGRPARL